GRGGARVAGVGPPWWPPAHGVGTRAQHSRLVRDPWGGPHFLTRVNRHSGAVRIGSMGGRGVGSRVQLPRANWGTLDPRKVLDGGFTTNRPGRRRGSDPDRPARCLC